MENTENTNNIRVGISHGDFNGIGYEVIIKALLDSRMNEICTPIVYGSSKIASYHRKTLTINDFSFNLVKKASMANIKRPNIINCYDKEVKIELGKSSSEAGHFAFLSLECIIEDLKLNNVDVLVTAPINKKNIQSDKFSFPGHTEYLAKKFNTENYLMLMVNESIRIGVATGHIALKDVPSQLTTELIMQKLRIMNSSLKMDFGIRKPKIALLGLNPHSGDGGIIGKEEKEIIIPAINKAFDENILAFGPFPADGFFGSSKFKEFDAILAMYHDQGLIPFKTLSFSNGVNFTAGLPIVRTSPGHGTAYEIAGKNMASPDSFRSAIYLACDIFKNRKEYKELTKNTLAVNAHLNDNGVDETLEDTNMDEAI
ncbi:4-hydroxythreonine-4-phosphate dehydrogenase PdxA [Bacteroidota bacterium]